MGATEPRYSIVIQWSDEDLAYVVSLPEWGDLMHTHGDTYEEALRRGRELIDLLMASRRAATDMGARTSSVAALMAA